MDKRDYSEIVNRRMVVLPGNFAYPMPRYYKTKIYGEKNLLSFKLLCSLEKILDDLHVRKLAHVQSTNPNWSQLQAFRFLDRQASEDAKYSHINKIKELSNFYSRSKL